MHSDPRTLDKYRMLLVIQYIKDRKGREVTAAEIAKYPYHRQLGWYWDALANYQLEDYHLSLNEIYGPYYPGQKVKIRQNRSTIFYSYSVREGQFVFTGDAPDSVYKWE